MMTKLQVSRTSTKKSRD